MIGTLGSVVFAPFTANTGTGDNGFPAFTPNNDIYYPCMEQPNVSFKSAFADVHFVNNELQLNTALCKIC
ncbi:MAG: hypothetical protein IPN99_14175 [Bacteroidetes bacterium]|nr:hypothetical protein [Bacteroidota bacterium]